MGIEGRPKKLVACAYCGERLGTLEIRGHQLGCREVWAGVTLAERIVERQRVVSNVAEHLGVTEGEVLDQFRAAVKKVGSGVVKPALTVQDKIRLRYDSSDSEGAGPEEGSQVWGRKKGK